MFTSLSLSGNSLQIRAVRKRAICYFQTCNDILWTRKWNFNLIQGSCGDMSNFHWKRHNRHNRFGFNRNLCYKSKSLAEFSLYKNFFRITKTPKRLFFILRQHNHIVFTRKWNFNLIKIVVVTWATFLEKDITGITGVA